MKIKPIDLSIYDYKRVPRNLYDKVLNYARRAGWKLNGEVFHGCEVCWTCALFRVESQSCVWRDLGSVKIESMFIEDPEWYRCSYWEEG